MTYLDRQMVADIQGFPPEWDWSGQKAADVNLMIANAVPPPLARALGQVIMARHNGKRVPPMAEAFRNILLRRVWRMLRLATSWRA